MISVSEALLQTQRLLREAEAAEILNVAEATLKRWRWAGRGPAFLKIGGAVRYHPAVLAAYIDASKVSPHA